jgi:catechol 2,3-dioxygenase-like lactoylglutathione lyase family enzyme
MGAQSFVNRTDLGLTHLALAVRAIDASVDFYKTYAGMQVVHQRKDAGTGVNVAWLSDLTRPFVIVLIESGAPASPLRPLSHLGVALRSRGEVDRLCEQARREARRVDGPQDSGYPVGYWAFIEDPDGHTVELSFGQEIAFTVEDFHRHARVQSNPK